MCPLLELQVRLRCFELYGPRLAPNGTYFITPPSLWEGREESSGEGQSDRNSVSGLNNEVRPPRPLPRPTLPEEGLLLKVSTIGLAPSDHGRLMQAERAIRAFALGGLERMARG